MFDFNKIGMKARYSTGYKPEVTNMEITELEKHCGHSLPQNYKFILKHYHGGIPEAQAFDAMDGEMDIPVGFELHNFYIVNEHKNRPLNIWWVIENYSALMGPSTLPFADDGYSRVYYMKWVNDIPQVWVLLLSEEGPETFQLFNSFDELLGALYSAE